MLHLSLLNDTGLLLPREQAAQIGRAMADGSLYVKAHVLTVRAFGHPYVADKQETHDLPTPIAIRSEADALALIDVAKVIYQQTNAVRVELLVYTEGHKQVTAPMDQFRITRYCPDADASGLSLLNEDYVHLESDDRRELMTRIHEGLAVVTGHQLLYLPEKTDDKPSIVEWPYPSPVSIVSGAELMGLIEQVSASSIVDNLVSVLLEVRLLTNGNSRYFVEVYKPSHMEWTDKPTLREFDWLYYESSLFHSLKYRGKVETEAEILKGLKRV